jgi:hypothetical protein
MTTAGKILSFLNLIVAVGLLTWGLSAYANRADWVDQKSDAGTVKGQITLLNEEVTRLTKAINDAQTGYGAEYVALIAEEGDRDYRRNQFAFRLDVARQDKDPKGGSFRRQVPQQPPGNPAFTNLSVQGPAVPGPDGKPLRGLRALQDEFAKEVQQAQRWITGQPVTQPQWNQVRQGLNQQQFDTLTGQMGIADLRKLHEELSVQIKRADDAVAKQKEIRQNLKEEARFLADNQTNWVVQLQTLERRQRQLENRLQQLGAKTADAR